MNEHMQIQPLHDQGRPHASAADPFGWYDAGAAMLRRNFTGFTDLVDRARIYLKVRDHAAAVAFAEVAAFHAVSSPCGLFGNAKLGDLLVCGSRQGVKQDGAAALELARFN